MPEETQAQAAEPTAQTAPEQSTASAQPEQTWEDRYNEAMRRFAGQQRVYQELQQVHTQTIGDLTAQREQAQAAQEAAQAATGELSQAQKALAQHQQALAETRAQAQQAMQEAAYWQLVQSQYPDLLPFANTIARAGTVEQQVQLLDSFREALGQRTQQGVRQGVAENFAGVTPTGGGESPAAAQQEYTYGEIVGNVMNDELARSQPEVHQAWLELYRQSPVTGPSSMRSPGQEFNDPYENDFQARQRLAGQQPAALNQRLTVQQVDHNPGQGIFTNAPQVGGDGVVRPPTTIGAPRPPRGGGMPNAIGGPNPPGANS